MAEETSLDGVSTRNSAKPKGGGKSMLQQTSRENSSSKDNIGYSDSTESVLKQKERSRRTKEGFQIYQVKKKTAVSQYQTNRHSSNNSNSKNNQNYKNDRKKYDNKLGYRQSSKKSQKVAPQNYQTKKQHYHRFNENRISNTTLSNSLSSREDWDSELRDDTSYASDISRPNFSDNSDSTTASPVPALNNNISLTPTPSDTSQETHDKENINNTSAVSVTNENTDTEKQFTEPVVSVPEEKKIKRPLTEREFQMKLKGQLLLECPCKYMPEDVDHSCVAFKGGLENDSSVNNPEQSFGNELQNIEDNTAPENDTDNIEDSSNCVDNTQTENVHREFNDSVNIEDNTEQQNDISTQTLSSEPEKSHFQTDISKEKQVKQKISTLSATVPSSSTQGFIEAKDNDPTDISAVFLTDNTLNNKNNNDSSSASPSTKSNSNCQTEVQDENICENEPDIIDATGNSKEKLNESKIAEINSLFVGEHNHHVSQDVRNKVKNDKMKEATPETHSTSSVSNDSLVFESQNKSDSSIEIHDGSGTVTTFSDSSENKDVSRNSNGERARRRSSESKRTPEQLQRSRQRNFMSSIVSILNENKHFDETHKQINPPQDIPRKYTSDRTSSNRKEPSNEKKKKREKRSQKKKEQNKNKRKTSNNQKQQVSETEENWMSDESVSKSPKRGLIYLPESDIEKTPDPINPDKKVDITPKKHVHFDGCYEKVIEESSDKTKAAESIEDSLSIINDLKNNLDRLLKTAFQDIELVKETVNASEMIQQKYGDLIIQHPNAAIKNDYEGMLWKTAFHNVILRFRKFLDESKFHDEEMKQIGSMYWQFLQNGIQFLDELMLQIQERQDMSLDDYIRDPIKISTCSKKIKLSLRSCHLLLIYIGDLERYICQLRQDDSYQNAQECYKKAQILAPKNGKSYNQLAVVAVYIKHKLDAVYYYARSLQASNPILTAKERLTSIFFEIKRKAEAYNQKEVLMKSVEHQMISNTPTYQPDQQYSRQTDHLRDEVWTFYRQGKMFKVMLTNKNDVIQLTPNDNMPTEHVAVDRVDSREERRITLKKINRGFIINFLYIHCKLYTNVGLETFTLLHQETLSDLATLLKYPKVSSIKEENLIKYMAINIFTIHILIDKQGSNEYVRNSALDFAVTFGMDMFSILCKHCVDTSDLSSCSQYLAAIRVWMIWMSHNTDLVIKSSASEMIDIWASICDFMNTICGYPVNVDITLSEDENENQYLSEDLLLSGFKPLQQSLKCIRPNPSQLNEAFLQFRINDMINLITQMNQYGDLPFAFDERDNLYKAIQPSATNVSPQKNIKNLDFDDIDESDASEDVVIGEDDDDTEMGDMSHIADLKLQKAALEKQIEENERKRQAALSVIESHKSQGRHISENSPTYLVADTNCYIDHIEYIQAIVDSKDFTLIVPLIVINELDGLKVGSYFDVTRYQQAHQRFVQEKARIAVDYLEDRFSKHDSNIRAITSSGSEMDTIVFRAEEFSSDRGTNDDVILSCCLKYCTEHVSREAGESSIVHRNVVLLTNDRNLRLKAHTRYVPTVDLGTFMRMARFM